MDAGPDVRNGEEAVRLGHLSPGPLLPQILIRDYRFRQPFVPDSREASGSLKKSTKGAGAIRRIAQVDGDGARFFHRASLVAADPRVKYIFSHASEEYGRGSRVLVTLVGKAKSKPKVPTIFPFEKYDTIECYVCGYEAKVDDLPDTCPSCASPQYAFNRETSQAAAWDLVARTTRKAAAFAKKEGSALKDGDARKALAAAAEIRNALLKEAKEGKASAGGAA